MSLVEISPQDIAWQIVSREGGYVDDPDDPGGPTNHGVTIGTMRRLAIDIDGDGAITEADVRALSKEQAVEIFLEHYFRGPRIDWLPNELHGTVFDMAVNAGSHAVRILQRTLLAFGRDVVVDGRIGPQTARETEALASAGAPLRDAYGIARREYYFALADKRPAFRKYVRTRAGNKGGWIRRAEDFTAPRYRMSAADFRARCAAWEGRS